MAFATNVEGIEMISMKKKFKDIPKEDIPIYIVQNKPIICMIGELCYIVRPDSVFSEEVQIQMMTIGKWKVLLEEGK